MTKAVAGYTLPLMHSGEGLIQALVARASHQGTWQSGRWAGTPVVPRGGATANGLEFSLGWCYNVETFNVRCTHLLAGRFAKVLVGKTKAQVIDIVHGKWYEIGLTCHEVQ